MNPRLADVPLHLLFRLGSWRYVGLLAKRTELLRSLTLRGEAVSPNVRLINTDNPPVL